MTLFVAIMLVVASAIVGAVLMLIVGWKIARRFINNLGRDERTTFDLWAALHRWFSQASGYDAIALTTEDGRIVVALGAITEAIELRDLLTHEPVSVKPPSEPPPPDTERGTCDGHA